ncbi:MAG: hypothetical protein HFJ42_06755 [Clostridia bacterium]|nr:hypothetical protein [Clostridia bacterium]
MNTEKKKINIKFNVLAIIAIIILCFAISPKTLQNDTFYTIKIGELILNNGIDMCDHFSWHENLPYTYPHWAYDTGIYLIYNLGELTGIENGGMLFIYLSTVILACILGILIYYINNKLTKNKLVSFFISMFAIYLLRDFIAARAQLVTFILFALTVLFIENFLETKKKIYLLGMIIISIAIANIHVAVWPFFFVLFLPYIAEYIIASIAEKNVISRLKVLNKKSIIKNIEKQLNRQVNEKKIEKLNEQLNKAKEELIYEEEKLERVKQTSDNLRQKPYKIKVTKNKAVKWIVLVMIICAFTGLLTPLGDAPYTYLAKTMQGNTTASISEHLPLTLYNNKEAMVTLALFFIMLIFTDVKIKLSDLFMLAGLIYLSFMSRRQVSLLVLIGGFIFSKLLKYLTEKYDLEGCERFTKFMTTIIGKACTIIIVALVAFSLYKPKRNAEYINNISYPVEASTWILENLDVENIRLYNEYNYGSYLLFRGIPVFIDSRADLYAPEFNGTKKEDGKYEGRDIFSDYTSISSIGTYYENKFEEYDITHLIMVKNAKLNMFLSRDSKYKKLYSDDKFIIYERNK